MLRGVKGPATVVLGVDIGTTSAKAVAFDVDGRELSRGEAGYALLEPEPGQAVQDPDAVIDGTLGAIRAAASAARDKGARIEALSFSGAMHSLVGLDGDGRALTPLITWGDMRATEQAERLRAEHPDLHDRTGTPLHPMAPLAKLLWLAEHEPATFAATRRWAGVEESSGAAGRRVNGRPLDGLGSGLRPPGARLGPRGARRGRRGRREAVAARAPPSGFRWRRRPRASGPRGGAAARHRGGRRAARQPRRGRRAPWRGGLLDRHQRRAAADGRAPGNRSRAQRVLLRADAGALDRRRRRQQRRRRAALGGRGAGARPRRTRRPPCSSWPRTSRPAATGC